MSKRNLNKIHIERQQKILENAVEDDLLKTKEKFNMLANETKEALTPTSAASSHPPTVRPAP